MHSEACGHTLISPEMKRDLTVSILQNITDSDIATAVSDMLGHLSPNVTFLANTKDETNKIRFPATIVACAPTKRQNNTEFTVNASEVCT